MHTICTRLLVMFIKKPDSPSATMCLTRRAWRGKYRSFRVSSARRPVRNFSTQAAEMAWEMTVARAAPFTPMFSRKMKMGSRTMFTAAPSTTVIIPTEPNPWALTKGFMPRLIITNKVPMR